MNLWGGYMLLNYCTFTPDLFRRYFNPIAVPMLFVAPILKAPELTVPGINKECLKPARFSNSCSSWAGSISL